MLKKLYAEYISRTVNILTSCAFSNSRTQSIKNMESLKECHITSLSFRMLYCFILLVRGKKTEYLINCWLLHFHFLDMVSDFSRGLNFANGNFSNIFHGWKFLACHADYISRKRLKSTKSIRGKINPLKATVNVLGCLVFLYLKWF